MYTIQLHRSLLVFWEDLVFLESALLASTLTRHLADPVTEHLALFDTIFAGDLATRRELIRVSARSSVADFDLDEGVRDLQSGLLHEVRQDRKDRRYTTLFKQGLSHVIRHALANQVNELERLVKQLALPIYTDAFRERWTTRFHVLIAYGREVLDQREAAETGRMHNRLKIDDWKNEANAIRLSVYAELLAIAARERKPKSWARTFFPAAQTRSGTRPVVDDADLELEPAPGEEEPAPV